MVENTFEVIVVLHNLPIASFIRRFQAISDIRETVKNTASEGGGSGMHVRGCPI